MKFRDIYAKSSTTRYLIAINCLFIVRQVSQHFSETINIKFLHEFWTTVKLFVIHLIW